MSDIHLVASKGKPMESDWLRMYASPTTKNVLLLAGKKGKKMIQTHWLLQALEPGVVITDAKWRDFHDLTSTGLRKQPQSIRNVIKTVNNSSRQGVTSKRLTRTIKGGLSLNKYMFTKEGEFASYVGGEVAASTGVPPVSGVVVTTSAPLMYHPTSATAPVMARVDEIIADMNRQIAQALKLKGMTEASFKETGELTEE